MTSTDFKVEIKVKTQYLPDQSPEKDQYAFAYHITVMNSSSQTIQLLNRYWLITDGNGKNTEVQGPGVVGQQPHIAAGERFQYTSGAILDTPVGSMQGYYEMQAADGTKFKSPIDIFSLGVPNLVN